jgi:hypothetical protein
MAAKCQVRQNPSMKFIKPLFTLSFSIALYAQTPTMIDLRGAQVVMEYTGQVTNVGTGSIQVGYLNYVKGFNAVFSAGATQDESTALFTFFTSAITTRSVLNGTIRSVTREGTTTIYLAKGPGDFTNPDSFRSGTPVQTSSMLQQVLIDTVTSGFTVSNYNVINGANLFTVNGSAYQLGAPGQTFRTELTGHLTASGPPSGYFGGYAVGSSDTAPFLGANPNPAPPADSSGLVQVTLTWGAPGVSQVEIHVGAPDGPLMAIGGPTGSMSTGLWVVNGTRFFLQDGSGGKPLMAANTLAQLTVIVRP